MPDALERIAATMREALRATKKDPLPPLEDICVTTDSGVPTLLCETLDAYEWASHLRLRPNPNTETGEVMFTGTVNGVRWSLRYFPESLADSRELFPSQPDDRAHTSKENAH